MFVCFFLPFFPAESTSCKNRCDEKYNAENTCHCNSRCTEYQNCCSDFTELCKTLRPTMCHLVTAHLVSRVPLGFFLAYLQWHLVAFTWFRVNSSLYTWAFYFLWFMYLEVFVTMELVTVILTATKCTLTTLQQCTLKIYHLLIIIHCNMAVILSHVFSDSYLRWWRIFHYLYIFVHFTYILLTV